jgi:hypothetical protein
VTTAPPLTAIPFRQMLDEAVRQARRHFRRIYPAVAIPMALAAGLLPLAQGFFMRDVMPTTGTRRPPDVSSVVIGASAFGIAFFVFFAVTSVAYGAMFTAVTDALGGREISMRRAWTAVLRPRMLGTMLLFALAVGVGTLFCLLPGLYLGLLFAFTVPVMIEESRFGTAALRRSAELARYNPQRQFDADPRLHVFVTWMVGAMLGYAVTFVIQLPFMVVQQVMVFRDVAGGQRPDPAQMMARMTWLQIPTQMLGMLAQSAVHLYICFGLALIFFDVRQRKEGLDLEAAVADLLERHRRRRLP